MSFTEIKRKEIKKYLLKKIDDDDPEFISKVSDAFGISTTSVKRYIDDELNDGHITGNSDARCGYSLVFTGTRLQYAVSELSEYDDQVIYKDILPLLNVNENSDRIWRYSLSEILNNAIEHSSAANVTVHIDTCYLYTRISLTDDGIGIFKHVAEAMKGYGKSNASIDDAVTELYKGKFTSDPDHHTGEGIFFTMRLLDKTSIISDGTLIRHGYDGESTYIRSHLLAYAMKLTKKGTVVIMQLSNDTSRDPAEVFDTYTDMDEGFYKTRIPVFEACLDSAPIARSQARRLCLRLDSFKEVILDFEKADIMGQGFADELFRVYQKDHPEVVLTPINMNADVQHMYLRTVNNKVKAPVFS